MAQRALNEIIYEGRIKSGLTRKQAAKKLHILPHLLKRLEYGYYHMSKKFIERAIELYGLDRAEVKKATQSYAGVIDKPKRAGAMSAFKEKRAVKITTLCISFITLLALIFCAVVQSLTLHNTSPFFSDNYKAFGKYMNDHGNYVEDTYDDVSFSVTWVEDLAFGYPVFRCSGSDDDYSFTMTSQPLYGFEHGNEINYLYFLDEDGDGEPDVYIPDEDGDPGIPDELFGDDIPDGGPDASAEPAQDEGYKIGYMRIIAVFKPDGEMDYIRSFVVDDRTIDDADTREQLVVPMCELYKNAAAAIDGFFAVHDDELKNFSYSELIGEISKTCYTLVILKIVTFFGLLLTVALIYPLTIWDVKIIVNYVKRKKNKRTLEEDDEDVDLLTGESNGKNAKRDAAAANADVMAEAAAAKATANADGAAVVADDIGILPRKRSRRRARKEKAHIYPLYLHESFIRAIGLIALLLGSSALIISINTMLYDLQQGGSFIATILFDKLHFYPLSEKPTMFLNNVLPFFKACMPMAVILLFFIKIDIMTSRSNMIRTVLTYAFVGLYIYFIQFIILDKTGMLQNTLEGSDFAISGNMFLGMTAYTLFAAFMLYTPEFAKKSKKGYYVWRSLAALPLAYLLVGSLVIPLVKVSPFVSAAFYSSASGTMSTIFVIFYVVAIYVLQGIRRRRYTQHTPIHIRRGKAFYFMKNIAAAVVLTLAVLIDFLLSLSPKTAGISSGASWYTLVAIPFILCYQPRLEPRRGWADILFIALYFFAYTISFSTAAIWIASNPYSSQIFSFVGGFVKSFIRAILLA